MDTQKTELPWEHKYIDEHYQFLRLSVYKLKEFKKYLTSMLDDINEYHNWPIGFENFENERIKHLENFNKAVASKAANTLKPKIWVKLELEDKFGQIINHYLEWYKKHKEETDILRDVFNPYDEMNYCVEQTRIKIDDLKRIFGNSPILTANSTETLNKIEYRENTEKDIEDYEYFLRQFIHAIIGDENKSGALDKNRIEKISAMNQLDSTDFGVFNFFMDNARQHWEKFRRGLCSYLNREGTGEVIFLDLEKRFLGGINRYFLWYEANKDYAALKFPITNPYKDCYVYATDTKKEIEMYFKKPTVSSTLSQVATSNKSPEKKSKQHLPERTKAANQTRTSNAQIKKALLIQQYTVHLKTLPRNKAINKLVKEFDGSSQEYPKIGKDNETSRRSIINKILKDIK